MMAIGTTRRRLIWGAAASVVVVLLALALRPKPVAADFGTITRGSLQATLVEEGETRVRDRFVVSAPLAGRVLRIAYDPGETVVAGETVLAMFEPGEPGLLDVRSRSEAEARIRAARAALGKAEAERERARAEKDFAETELRRTRGLAAQGIVSEEQLDSKETAVRTRAEALQAAEFAVRSAKYGLEVATAGLLQPGTGTANRNPDDAIAIRSPVDGVVLRVLRESEAIVPAGEPLIEVADPHDLEIVADYLSTDAVKIRPGQPVLIEQWGGDHPIRGRVERVEPSGFTKISALGVEEQRVNVIVDFEDPVDAWSMLGDAFRVEVHVIIWQGDGVLKVPSSSLFREQGEWAVFAVESGKAALRPVEIGRRGGLEAEVISGLAEGDEVIVHPSDLVEDGVSVAPR
jgi:HlyD family secretion protein